MAIPIANRLVIADIEASSIPVDIMKRLLAEAQNKHNEQ